MFNMYEESVRVPLVFSNPVLYPSPLSSNALVSHVDFVPTMATLLGAPAALTKAAGWQGVSYADVVVDPVNNAKSPQDEILFTYDDFQYGQSVYLGIPVPPNHVRAIVEERWKVRREHRGFVFICFPHFLFVLFLSCPLSQTMRALFLPSPNLSQTPWSLQFAEYFDPMGKAPSEFEMYDLLSDPHETNNLAFPSGPLLTPFQLAQRDRLSAKLQQVVATKLTPRLGVKWPINMTATTALVQATELSRSDAGAVTGSPVGGAPVSQPGVTIEIVYTPIKGSSLFPASLLAFGNSGGGGSLDAAIPCVADVQWSVFSGAGSMFGAAKAFCSRNPDGGVNFSGTASIYAGTSSFRGLRADKLKFTASSPPPGPGITGSLSITGIAETKSLAAA